MFPPLCYSTVQQAWYILSPNIAHRNSRWRSVGANIQRQHTACARTVSRYDYYDVRSLHVTHIIHNNKTADIFALHGRGCGGGVLPRGWRLSGHAHGGVLHGAVRHHHVMRVTGDQHSLRVAVSTVEVTWRHTWHQTKQHIRDVIANRQCS